MNSIQILTEAAASKRESARGHIETSEKLLAEAEAAQALADADNAAAEAIEADIALIKNGGAAPKPRVFAGKGASA
ncbi:hypothetical protein [Novosphingobium sp. NDB2Meth1]|uniref:hypothetical protein n=1 Tax=Novosphingobium sp. NDB2Meth1 TaxID=1892847 RepID=UPI000930917F|nr:hypothetical protein [Novosphingobium sp. NDB2Meth1]